MRHRRSTARLRAVAAALLVSACFPLVAHAEGQGCEHRALEVVYDDGADRLIVVDGDARRVTMFQVGQALIKTGSSLFDGAPGPGAEPIAVPASDAPGDDPPGWARPAGAVRVQSGYASGGNGERWDATYVIPGGPIAVFEAARAGFDGWTVDALDVGTNLRSGRRSASLGATQGMLEADLHVDDRARLPEGWTAVRVQVKRRR